MRGIARQMEHITGGVKDRLSVPDQRNFPGDDERLGFKGMAVNPEGFACCALDERELLEYLGQKPGAEAFNIHDERGGRCPSRIAGSHVLAVSVTSRSPGVALQQGRTQ